MKENKNTTHQDLWDTVKNSAKGEVYRYKCITKKPQKQKNKISDLKPNFTT